MLISTKKRSIEAELMDDFDMKGEVLEKTLQDIARLNKWLGGNKITLNGVTFLLKNESKEKTYTIADIGCGNGDMLREIANWGRKKGYQLNLMGVDANIFTIEKAKELSSEYAEIDYIHENIFDATYTDRRFDIILCTLTLHHFENQKINNLLGIITNQAKVGVVINDLQRSSLSYYLFKLVCLIFISNPMARYDGAISILSGFKKRELLDFAEKLPSVSHDIRWKWAFRYRWVLKKKF